MQAYRPFRWSISGVTLAIGVTAWAATPEAADEPEAKGQHSDGDEPEGATRDTPSAAQQADLANVYSAKIATVLRRLEQLVSAARRDKDVIKLNCLNDKLLQAKGLSNVAEQARRFFQNAVTQKDDGAREHEFSRLTIAHQKIVVLAQEGEACVGEELAYVEKTEVEVEIDPAQTEEDPTRPLEYQPIVERPPTASAYQ